MNNPEIIAEFIETAIKKQSWYRQHANVINGVIAATAGTLIYILTYFQTTGDVSFGPATTAVVIPVITGVALRFTKNGIGKKQGEDLKEHAVAEDKKKNTSETSETAGFPDFQVDRG